ncbi:hypothetical protein ACO0LG_08610 [Undibacterium sp. Ji42W]|uniref:hypothetical protein n=1 Tax=Undibacterium sp. Ji42W TaxID=3413039 RepID=UPI003BEF9438
MKLIIAGQAESPIMRAAYKAHLQQLTQELALLPIQKRKHVSGFVYYVVCTLTAFMLALASICLPAISYGLSLFICLASAACAVSFIITVAMHLSAMMALRERQKAVIAAVAYLKMLAGENHGT